jgi:hypothetical protein
MTPCKVQNHVRGSVPNTERARRRKDLWLSSLFLFSFHEVTLLRDVGGLPAPASPMHALYAVRVAPRQRIIMQRACDLANSPTSVAMINGGKTHCNSRQPSSRHVSVRHFQRDAVRATALDQPPLLTLCR